MYLSYWRSSSLAAAICSCLAGISMLCAHWIEHAQCWNGTHVLPRYGFLNVITLYPEIQHDHDIPRETESTQIDPKHVLRDKAKTVVRMRAEISYFKQQSLINLPDQIKSNSKHVLQMIHNSLVDNRWQISLTAHSCTGTPHTHAKHLPGWVTSLAVLQNPHTLNIV